MTLYWPPEARLIDHNQPHLHVLIVGVGEYPHLSRGTHPNPRVADVGSANTATARYTALRIAEWFGEKYKNAACSLGSIELLVSPSLSVRGPRGGGAIHIEEANLPNVGEAQKAWKERCDQNSANVSLFYFAGHGTSADSRSHYLLLSDFGDDKEQPWNCIDFPGFRAGVEGSSRAATRLYFVDACRDVSDAIYRFEHFTGYAFRGNERYRRPAGTASVYYAAGPGQETYGQREDITYFAKALLESLNGAAAREDNVGRQVVDTHTLRESMEKLLLEYDKELKPRLDVAPETVPIHFPPTPSTDRPLEEALGYATRAFREYLNKNVVDGGVELIYFLSYDVWDGCLLYDGLVRGSIEQGLIDYIRREFLGGDRLRSKYEELKTDEDDLGMAGRCFKWALSPDKRKNPLLYMGDLSSYMSEYGAFDQMLGLVSCIYIPVVGDLIPEPPRESDPTALDRMMSDPSPLGGVLMAANRKPYGLRPKGWSEQQVRPASGQDYQKKNGEIAEAIAARLQQSADQSRVHDFLKCIGGVYSQKASSRLDLRRTMNPTFTKAVARSLKRQYGSKYEKHKDAIEKIGHFVTSRTPQIGLEWLAESRDDWGECRAQIRDLIHNEQEQRDLYWSYRMGCVWRDLRLEELNLTEQSSQEERLGEVKAALGAKLNAIGIDGTLEGWITGEPTATAGRQSKQKDVSRYQLKFVEELIDDLRKSPEGPFKIISKPFRQLAPLEPYVRSVEEIEGLLASTGNETHLHHIAHSLQIWMLGASVLEQQVGEGGTVRDYVVRLIYGYFKHNEKTLGIQGWGDLHDKWGSPSSELVDLFWGLIAATHDIAVPLQSFQDWCRNFFVKYFGEKTVAPFDSLPVFLDVFHDPRFPFHKSAITNHYPAQQRNWLESMFHLGLSSRIDHALAGALILMREISPDEGEKANGIWREVTDRLEKLSDVSQPERGLVVPAYLAHAIAFSHLANMRWKWKERYSEKESTELRSRNNPPKYFAETAEAFRVEFDKFPLTYLVALFETLLDPRDEAWMTDMKKRRRIDTQGLRTAKGPVSPFYVEKVDWVPGSEGQELALHLCLWGAEREVEREVVCLAQDLDNMAKAFARRTDILWKIYEPDFFRKESPRWDDQSKGRGWIKVKEDEYGLPRTTYNLLLMKLRLDQFRASYIGGKRLRFAVEFENVKKESDESLKAKLLLSLGEAHG